MSDADGEWLSAPHHDGSALYVSDLAPQHGDLVTVWLKVPTGDTGGTVGRVHDVHVRVVADAEQWFVPASLDEGRSDDVDTWWRAQLRCHNRVTSYRWLLIGDPVGYAWVNGTGIHRRDVPDASDFRLVSHPAPPPADAVDAVVYQVFPDRFAASEHSVVQGTRSDEMPDWAVPAAWDDPVESTRDSPLVSRQLYGGDLDGVREHLDHLERLGATTLYLTPFFPARSNHRYDASTFEHVDPVLGGDDALRRLVDEAHARGLRVLGDFTTNHTGSSHEWFVTAREDPASVERGFYFWTGPDSYVGWYGVPSLPKLNYDSVELRRRVIEDPKGVVKRWLGPEFGLDGWRVDVANMTGRQGIQDLNHEVAALVRDAVAQVRPDALVVGEHTHDYTTDLPGDGWHGVMNYAGFTRPVWTWLCDARESPEFLGAPVVVPQLDGVAMVETIRDFTSRVSWQGLTHSFNLVGSHDTSRIRSLVAHDPRLVEVAAGLLLTMPSIPMITYGDEIGMPGIYGEDGRRPMPWDESQWDTAIFELYRRLVETRRGSLALRRGGLRWVYAGPDVLVYLREAADEVALVHIARAAHPPIELDASRLPGVDQAVAKTGVPIEIRADTLTLHADAPTVGIHVWRPESRGGRREQGR